MQTRLTKSRAIVVALLVLSAAYLLLAGSTIDDTTIQYDEYTDLVISSSLSNNPLAGHSHDPSQARFPMYATAATYRLLRIVDPDMGILGLLPFSRWLSILMTVVAIWGTYLLGRRLFGVAAGILAACIFTFSPYVLHFGRDALTQGDAFTSATVVFTLIAFERFVSRRTTFWLFCVSICLALAIAAKFILVILIPALISYQLLLRLSQRFRPHPYGLDSSAFKGKTSVEARFIVLAVGAGISALLALLITQNQTGQGAIDSNILNRAPRLLWAMALACVFLTGVLAVRDLRISRRAVTAPARHWNLGLAWLAILPLSFAVLMAVFPVHIFNPAIMPTLISRFITMDGNGDLLATSLNSAKLYFGLILIKPGLPFGILTILALAWAVKEAVRDNGALLISVVLAFFGLMLVVMPLQQPFWLMSVYPLIAIALSAMIVGVYGRLQNTRLRPAWAGLIVLAAIWLVIGLVRVYPTYGYYGYEVVGDTWLGNESRGFRRLIIVTNDGSTEVINWLRDHAPAGSSVISYLNDVHIMNYLNRIDPFDFELAQVLSYADEDDLERDLAKADYVVVSLVNDTRFPSPLSDPGFSQHFGAEPVYQFGRGRGTYEMPLIHVYQRHPDTSALVIPGRQ